MNKYKKFINVTLTLHNHIFNTRLIVRGVLIYKYENLYCGI